MMSGFCPQVVLDLVELHTKHKEKKSSENITQKAFSLAGNFVKSAYELASGREYTETQLQQIKNNIEIIIAKPEIRSDKFQQIRLLFTLEAAAEKAQQAKLLATPSTLCKTIYAAMNYMFEKFQTSEYKNEFVALKQTLNNELIVTNNLILEDMNKNSGRDQDKLREKRREIVRQLAILGDATALAEASSHGFFDYYPEHKTSLLSWHIADYCAHVYKHEYQNITLVDFRKFESDSRIKWQAKEFSKQQDAAQMEQEEMRRREQEKTALLQLEAQRLEALRHAELLRQQTLAEEAAKRAAIQEELAKNQQKFNELQNPEPLAKSNDEVQSSSSAPAIASPAVSSSSESIAPQQPVAAASAPASAPSSAPASPAISAAGLFRQAPAPVVEPNRPKGMQKAIWEGLSFENKIIIAERGTDIEWSNLNTAAAHSRINQILDDAKNTLALSNG